MATGRFFKVLFPFPPPGQERKRKWGDVFRFWRLQLAMKEEGKEGWGKPNPPIDYCLPVEVFVHKRKNDKNVSMCLSLICSSDSPFACRPMISGGEGEKKRGGHFKFHSGFVLLLAAFSI